MFQELRGGEATGGRPLSCLPGLLLWLFLPSHAAGGGHHVFRLKQIFQFLLYHEAAGENYVIERFNFEMFCIHKK